MFNDITYTENDMPTNKSSLSKCVDFFSIAGSSRNLSEYTIIDSFDNALDENSLIAMKTLFWARDIRGGQGERRLFRICLRHLQVNYPEYLDKVIELIPEYGRWDDLFHLSQEKIFPIIKENLKYGNGLLAKWLPRKGMFAVNLRNYLGLSPKKYRKALVYLSKTVEQRMCAKEWNKIEYRKVPSIAMNKYRKAFKRNDGERFSEFLNRVKKGEEKIHAGTLYPYHLYQAFERGEDQDAVEAQWNALPNFMKDNNKMILPMCDTSGSMTVGYGTKSLSPMDISVSLGIYISERNEGPFKNAFMTFSESPQIQYLKGSFSFRCQNLRYADWGMNTNIEAAFEKILDIAKRNDVKKDEMPNVILILSDMQFDQCVDYPDDKSFDMIKRQYNEKGYDVPSLVFWNINARSGQSPVTVEDRGTCIVSGCSPSILETILSGDIIDPYKIMLKAVTSERYEPIKI